MLYKFAPLRPRVPGARAGAARGTRKPVAPPPELVCHVKLAARQFYVVCRCYGALPSMRAVRSICVRV